MSTIRSDIRNTISHIDPFDDLEREHRDAAISWINEGAEIFRISKPDNPPIHLVSYFALIDESVKKILLVDHIDAEKWLPSGGHVEKNEYPLEAARRECAEELQMEADFIFDEPLFITRTKTSGKSVGHTDVSLWFVLRGDSRKDIVYDDREFHGYKWFDFKEVLEMDVSLLDPHMHRFMQKYIQDI